MPMAAEDASFWSSAKLFRQMRGAISPSALPILFVGVARI